MNPSAMVTMTELVASMNGHTHTTHRKCATATSGPFLDGAGGGAFLFFFSFLSCFPPCTISAPASASASASASWGFFSFSSGESTSRTRRNLCVLERYGHGFYLYTPECLFSHDTSSIAQVYAHTYTHIAHVYDARLTAPPARGAARACRRRPTRSPPRHTCPPSSPSPARTSRSLFRIEDDKGESNPGHGHFLDLISDRSSKG